jgi:pimeloyl-ACP methyl ester carboxylesterase
MLENIKLLAGKISMQGHTAELAGGVSYLISDKDVDPAKIFALTNSEGCVHALNYQTQSGNQPFAGMVLTSVFTRATGELAHGQIAAQLSAIPGGDAMLSAYDAAMRDFVADRAVPVDESLPEGLWQLIQAITLPVNQPFARELWVFNPLARLTEISVPVLIIIGKKDIQVDWQTDGVLFEALAAEHRNIRVVYAENANHVLKFEPKPRSELTPAEVQVSYGSDEVMLDPEPVNSIISWLRAQALNL